MYEINNITKRRLANRVQTIENNADPRPQVYVTRNRSSITSQRFWDRQMITSSIGSRCSLATRRPRGALMPDLVVTAQIANGEAIVRSAVPTETINKMVWGAVDTITGITDISLVYDGTMELTGDVVECYTTGEYPYAVYVEVGGALRVKNLDDGEAPVLTIATNAVRCCAIRGLWSEIASLDDGIVVFWINEQGLMKETHIVNGAVTETADVPIRPSGVNRWADLWAGRTFDYRIVLQMMGDDGNVHTLLSKSRPSGYALREYMSVSMRVKGKIGIQPPKLLSCQNVPSGKNWGQVVRLTYDAEVKHVTTKEAARYRLIGHLGDAVEPIAVRYGDNGKQVDVIFEDFNNIMLPARLVCDGCIRMGSIDLPFSAFDRTINLINLHPVPWDRECLSVGIQVRGSLLEKQDIKLYQAEHMEITGIAISGQIKAPSFRRAYGAEYVAVSNMTVAGTIKHISDVDV